MGARFSILDLLLRTSETRIFDYSGEAATITATNEPQLVSASGSFLREEQLMDDLHDLIGGRQTVCAATESFYRRVFADDTLRPFFKSTDMAQLCARQSMFISMLLGGRVEYAGKDIHSAHELVREQGLNDGHFDRFLKHFREALNEVGVDADKVEKVAKLLETRRDAVLNP
jgi:hemoglobin